jgi:hypothetical protein
MFVLRGRLRWATTRHGWDGSRWAYERRGDENGALYGDGSKDALGGWL